MQGMNDWHQPVQMIMENVPLVCTIHQHSIARICRLCAKIERFFDKNEQKIKNVWNVAQKQTIPFWHIAQTNRLNAQKKSLKNVAQKQNNLLKNLIKYAIILKMDKTGVFYGYGQNL